MTDVRLLWLNAQNGKVGFWCDHRGDSYFVGLLDVGSDPPTEKGTSFPKFSTLVKPQSAISAVAELLY